MRDLSSDSGLLSLNGATVRQKWGLKEIIEGCAKRGFGGVAPWRDQVASYGIETTARHIRDAGIGVSGLCRGGMFPAATLEGRLANIADNRRPSTRRWR